MVGIASALEQNLLTVQRPAFGEGQSVQDQAAANAADQERAAEQTQASEGTAAGTQNDPNASQPSQAANAPGTGATLTTGFLSPVIQFDSQTSQVLFQFRDFETGDVERQIPPQQANQAFLAAGAEQGAPQAPAAAEENAETGLAALAAEAPEETEETPNAGAVDNLALAATDEEGAGDDVAAADADAAAAAQAAAPAEEEEPAEPVNAPFTAAVEETGEQAVATAGAAGPQAQPGPEETTPVTGAQTTPGRVDTVA